MCGFGNHVLEPVYITVYACLCVSALRMRWSCFGIHLRLCFIASPWCYFLRLYSLYVMSSRNGHVAQILAWDASYYYAITHAHSTHICMYRPLVIKKKKRKNRLIDLIIIQKRSPTKPIGAIPEDVLKRAKELAGDYQKLHKLLRGKAFREVGELNKPCKCQCRCGVRRQSGRRRVR